MSQNRLNFQRGVDTIFGTWSALELAMLHGEVEDAQDRFSWFKETIVKYFGTDGSKLYVDDVEEVLEDIMENEFNTAVEDGSIRIVADMLMRLYKECIAGKTEFLNEITSNKVEKKQHIIEEESSNDDDQVDLMEE